MNRTTIAPLAITAILLLFGTWYYVTTTPVMTEPGAYRDLFASARMKAAYLDGSLKLFATAPTTALSTLDAAEGRSTPGETTMVIGADEAAMMREEKLFTSTGESLTGFSGINTTIGGILAPTRTIIDMTHFLSGTQYDALTASDDLKLRIAPDGAPKLFLRHDATDTTLRFTLAEGDLAAYTPLQKDGKTYAPILIGADEAAMMREENLFTAVGDTIDGLFGIDVVIAGVLAPTGTALDMAHLVPSDAWAQVQ